MFGFLNRNKPHVNNNVDLINSNATTENAFDSQKNQSSTDNQMNFDTDKSILESSLAEAKKNLYDAIVLKRIDIVVSLMNEWFKKDTIKYFFNCNYCENNTTSPLLVAYNLKDEDLIRTLLNFGADPSLPDVKHKKNLIQMINEGLNLPNDNVKMKMKQLLCDSFMQLIVRSNLHSLRQFLMGGFEINSTDSNDSSKNFYLPDENSFLHWAVMYSTEPVVRLLLENGANVNAINKYGATPLHECIVRKASNANKKDILHIVETLLLYKADAVGLKGTQGVYKDLNALELSIQHDVEVHNLIKEFVNDNSSLSTSSQISSLPNSSLLVKSLSVPNESASSNHQNHIASNIMNSLDMMSLSPTNSLQPDISPLADTNNRKKSLSDLDLLNNWCSKELIALKNESLNTENKIKSLLWPQPQFLTIISEKKEDSFNLAQLNSQLDIYFKPPDTFTYMDMVNKIVSSFSEITFHCIHKPSKSPYISVTIDRTLFTRENHYSILFSSSKVEINAIDANALQYAFFTFMQVCKIFKNQTIPCLRIVDYSDVKYRAVLLDFSQGFYLKYENLLAILQMLAFYKINQVHFYVKFSSLPPISDRKQWYHYLNNNWFGLMKFCDEVNIQLVPSVDISNDVSELDDVIVQIKEYLDLFKGFKFLNIGPRLSSLLTCIENKNPFSLDSNQHMMLCSYLYHNGDEETFAELDKFEKYVLMEYGLKSGTQFETKSLNLYKSGKPFFYCIGSANWNSFLGCPDGCLQNINDAIKRQKQDQPLGILMCNFSGSLNKIPFAANLNSIILFAGLSWNTNISMEEAKQNIPSILLKHGIINHEDGELGVIILELGNLETYLTRKIANTKDFLDMPYDDGSVFTRLVNDPDNLDLDNLDRNIFKKILLNLRSDHSKLKSLLNANTSPLFKEVSLSADICLNLLKFLVTLFNTGTRQNQSLSKPIGLNVINVGVSNLSQTVRTDLANKLIMLKDEYRDILYSIYYEESVNDYLGLFYTKLIDKLLIDQDNVDLAEIVKYKQYKSEHENKNKLRSISTSSFQSNYYIQSSLNDDNQLLFKK